MTGAVRDGSAMVAAMRPRLDPAAYVFVTGAAPIAEALASFYEDEGLSQILPERVAQAAGLDTTLPMARIVLEVHSALDGVGLTAAVASALAAEEIACNMVAAFHHDHVFVPKADAERAIAVLQRLEHRANSA